MAGYKALYRKWRPDSFSDVIGQEHITSVLKNEIMSGTVSHAYLFCGSRGTGKTTCAKILAKAVSCSDTTDGNPCGKCPQCIAAENTLDIYEIDAASFNGVDNIRELRDTVVYPPSEMKRRVYIIDEVHMLSQGAFNALLKTLEEPPAHAMFILATTELQKIPATILSRCKRFDFHRITPEKIAERLRFISDSEGIKITDPALLLIAKLAAGAMRDALSMLELFYGAESEINEDIASERLGVVGREVVISLISAIASDNTEEALGIISTAYDNSKDLGVLCSEMSETLRDILIIKYTKNPEKLIDSTQAEIDRLEELAKSLSQERIMLCSDICEETQNKLSRSTFSRRALLENAVIRMSEPRLQTDIGSLLSRIADLETKLSQGIPASATNASADVKKEKPVKIPAETPPEIPQDMPFDGPYETPVPKPVAPKPLAPRPLTPRSAAAKAPEAAADSPRKQLSDFAEFIEICERLDKMTASMLDGAMVYLSDGLAEIELANPIAPTILGRDDKDGIVKKALSELTGKNYSTKYIYKKSDTQTKLPDLSSLTD